MSKKVDKIEEEIMIPGAEVMTEEEFKKAAANWKRKRTREANKLKKMQESENIVEVEEMNEKNKVNIDLDAILSVKKYKKKALSFYQDKSVSEALTAKAEASEKKNSEALNLILNSIIDLDNMRCLIDIEEKKEEKVANTFKIDERIIEVLNNEASSRNMSVNEYLNRVLKVVLNIG